MNCLIYILGVHWFKWSDSSICKYMLASHWCNVRSSRFIGMEMPKRKSSALMALQVPHEEPDRPLPPSPLPLDPWAHKAHSYQKTQTTNWKTEIPVMCRALSVLFNNIEDTCHTSELNSTNILYEYFPRKTFKIDYGYWTEFWLQIRRMK